MDRDSSRVTYSVICLYSLRADNYEIRGLISIIPEFVWGQGGGDSEKIKHVFN